MFKINLLKTIAVLSIALISMPKLKAQISPDILHLKFNEQPSSSGFIKNHASNASSYADFAKVIGLSIGGNSFCGSGLAGNGGRTSISGVITNAVLSNCKVDLNKSWTISMQVDGLIQPTL